MKLVVAGLLSAVIAAAVAVGVIILEPWNGDGELSFSMTLRANDDYEEAARRLEALLPDFECEGELDEVSERGVLGCEAGLTGFVCTFDRQEAVVLVCQEGAILTSDFPACAVTRPSATSQRIVRCSGPNTDAFCSMRFAGGLEVVCQRSAQKDNDD